MPRFPVFSVYSLWWCPSEDPKSGRMFLPKARGGNLSLINKRKRLAPLFLPFNPIIFCISLVLSCSIFLGSSIRTLYQFGFCCFAILTLANFKEKLDNVHMNKYPLYTVLLLLILVSESYRGVVSSTPRWPIRHFFTYAYGTSPSPKWQIQHISYT